MQTQLKGTAGHHNVNLFHLNITIKSASKTINMEQSYSVPFSWTCCHIKFCKLEITLFWQENNMQNGKGFIIQLKHIIFWWNVSHFGYTLCNWKPVFWSKNNIFLEVLLFFLNFWIVTQVINIKWIS